MDKGEENDRQLGKEIEAFFVGGPWDGKEYYIPLIPEFRIAMLKERLSASKFGDIPDRPAPYDIAVYRHAVNEIYWFCEIERHGQE